jgi:hypothetical protein
MGQQAFEKAQIYPGSPKERDDLSVFRINLVTKMKILFIHDRNE